MKDYTAPGEVQLAPDANLTRALWQHERENPDRAALAYRAGGQFVDVTSREFAEKVRAVAAGLIELGVKKGERVAVMSPTRIEWTYLDYAIWAAGAVTVPMYETSSAEQVEWIMSNSEAVAAFFGSATHKAVFDEVASKLTNCRHTFVLDDGGLDEVIERGASRDPAEVDARAADVGLDYTATNVYTSGTTGMPKGCVLTHQNFVWDSTQVSEHLGGLFNAQESTLLFLPLAHIFGRVIQVSCVISGTKVGYSTGIPNLMEELPMFKPTFLLSVPRVFEKVYNGAAMKAAADGKGAIFERAAQTAIDHSREARGGKVGLKTKVAHAAFDKLVYGKLRAVLGGNVRYCISGGAPLGERLGHFFDGIGVTILEGYGLTETTAGATLNTPNAVKIGTVGKPLPGVTIRIADDGEILMKGGHVFQGYYKNQEATAEAVDADGFFHTGDIGELDHEGYLRITGRKKDLIVTAAGKNVAPAVLEDRLNAHRLVSQSMVVGDNRNFIAALIAIDGEEFGRWAEANSVTGKTVADLADDDLLRSEIQNAVDNANKAVSKAESIRKFVVLPEDFTIEGNELTPTLKVKRNVVQQKYSQVIEDLYATSDSAA